MIETATSLLILVGIFFTLVGSLGLLRLPDVYNRLHATSKSGTLGVMSILLACAVFFTGQGEGLSFKPLAAIFFLFLSSPVGAHMISRAAYLVGVPLSDRTVRDDFKDRHPKVEHME